MLLHLSDLGKSRAPFAFVFLNLDAHGMPRFDAEGLAGFYAVSELILFKAEVCRLLIMVLSMQPHA